MAAISTAYPFPSTAAVPACLPNGPSHSGRLTARALQSSPRKSTALMFSTVNRGNFIKSNRGKDFFLPCSCSGSIKNENSDATTSREGAEAEKYEKKVLNGQPAMPSAAESPRIRPLSDDEREKRRRMEDELKDSRTFIDYLAPRPLRRIYFASGAVSCTVAFVVSLTKVVTEPSLQLAEGGIANVGINLAGAVLFGALFIWEGKQKEERVIQRKEIREAQIRLGDREVFVTPEGEKMSRLKPVDDEWIIRRLDRWGKQDLLPQVGPKKGAILQKLVRERRKEGEREKERQRVKKEREEREREKGRDKGERVREGEMAFETVDEGGRIILWVVFAIFLFNAIAMACLAYSRPGSAPLDDRMHYYATFAILAIATLAYYSMATGGGSLLVPVAGSTSYRELMYARYVDWALTTPLLLLDLVLLGVPSFDHTARLLFFDVGMILTGLFAALTSGTTRWGWYGFGCLFMVLVFWDLAISVRRQVFARSKASGALYDGLATLLILVWLLYPVVWGFGEGSNTISVDAEVACYAVLDVTAKVIFGWGLVLRLRSMGEGSSSIGPSSATP